MVIRQQIHLLVYAPVHLFILDSLTCSVIIHLLLHRLFDHFIVLDMHSCMRLSMHSTMHWFIHSLIHVSSKNQVHTVLCSSPGEILFGQ